MNLNNKLSKSKRDELVTEAVALLKSNYTLIAQQGLDNQLYAIAIGHMMRIANRDEIAKTMPEKAVVELDRLFSLMGIRALDEFTLYSQSVALARTMRGEVQGGPHVQPELGPLIKKRKELTREAEAIQKKLLLAAIKKKTHKALANQRAKKEKEMLALGNEIMRVAGISSNVGWAF